MAKLNTEEFIKKAREVHGDKYDYSKVEYVNNRIKVCIVCPIHGEFWQRPSHHIEGRGCSKCGKERTSEKRKEWTQEKCYETALQYSDVKTFRTNCKTAYSTAVKHQWLKDYTWLSYSNPIRWSKERCFEVASQYKEMSLFRTECESAYNAALRHKWLKDFTWLTYKIDVSKPKKQRQSYTQEDIIERLRSIFGDRYSYDKVVYKAMKVPVTLVCHEKDANGVEHGEFSMRPDNIFSGKQGCPKCYDDRRSQLQRKPVEKFIEEANKVHNGLYEYHKVNYINTNSKVCIVCKIHGDFWQTPSNHLKGQGCPYCSGNAKKWNKQTCEEEARKYKYVFDYSTKAPGAYNKARANGWLRDYIWLKKLPPKTDDYDKDTKYIYAYEFLEQKTVYVGITNSIKKRDSQHRNSIDSAVYQFAKECGCDIPLPKLLEERVPIQESGKQEAFWVDAYKSLKWKLLNRARTGERESSIGATYPLKWNKKAIREKAKECGYVLSTFAKEYPGAYEAIQSRYKGLLNELFPHRMIHAHHTIDDALLVVKNGHFQNRSQLRKTVLWAYRILSENGLLDEIFGKPKEYTKEQALIEADEYKSIEQIRLKNHSLWNFLRKNDLFRKAKPTDAMFHKVKSVEESWELSKYYKNVAELSNHAKTAYMLLRDAGMLEKRYPDSYSKIILQYSLDGEFIKEWPSATEASRALGRNIIGGIGLVCKGKKKSAGGFIWKYKDMSDNDEK